MSRPTVMNNERIHSYAKRMTEFETPVYFIFLVKDSFESRESINRVMTKFKDLSFKPVCLTFEDFLDCFFGREEKGCFQKSMLGFKDDFHKVIGYQVTEVCSPYNLNKLKEDLDEELKSFQYERVRAKHFEESRKNNPRAKDIFDTIFTTMHSK